MSVTKPFKRTCRQLIDGSYSNSGNWLYLHHPHFVQDPQHYVRAFEIIQGDFESLLEYIEPADQNLQTYSFRIHELLMRTCIEIEANLRAILAENIFTVKKPHKWSVEHFRIINVSHRLSEFKTALPVWNGLNNIRQPFKEWSNEKDSLPWYQAYNRSKHDRHQSFQLATFENLLDALGGLVVLLSAQFNDETYSPNPKYRALSAGYSYNDNDGMETAICSYFRVSFPTWPMNERYDFQWQTLQRDPNPIETIDYDAIYKQYYNIP